MICHLSRSCDPAGPYPSWSRCSPPPRSRGVATRAAPPLRPPRATRRWSSSRSMSFPPPRWSAPTAGSTRRAIPTSRCWPAAPTGSPMPRRRPTRRPGDGRAAHRQPSAQGRQAHLSAAAAQPLHAAGLALPDRLLGGGHQPLPATAVPARARAEPALGAARAGSGSPRAVHPLGQLDSRLTKTDPVLQARPDATRPVALSPLGPADGARGRAGPGLGACVHQPLGVHAEVPAPPAPAGLCGPPAGIGDPQAEGRGAVRPLARGRQRRQR